MSAAPAYIVYGHRHAVRLVTRLLAIGLLLAAIVTVGAVLLRQRDSGKPPVAAPGTHGGSAVTVATVAPRAHGDEVRREAGQARPPSRRRRSPRATSRPSRSRCPGKTPVMVLNSNGIHGVAHQLAAKVQSAGYPITYVGNAQKRGLPTIVQYAKGYGPGRAQAREARRQRAVRDPVRRHHAVAGQGREARRHPRHLRGLSPPCRRRWSRSPRRRSPRRRCRGPTARARAARLLRQPRSCQHKRW